MTLWIVIAIVVLVGSAVALMLARAAAIGDRALEEKRQAAKRHWWDW